MPWNIGLTKGHAAGEPPGIIDGPLRAPSSEEDQQNIRDEYVNLMAKMFRISGYSELASCQGREKYLAKRVLALETMMAKNFVDKVTLRDPYQTIHKCTPVDFHPFGGGRCCGMLAWRGTKRVEKLFHETGFQTGFPGVSSH